MVLHLSAQRVSEQPEQLDNYFAVRPKVDAAFERSNEEVIAETGENRNRKLIEKH